ncbi:MAG: YlbF family regulator [Gemmatimonadales bacterium]
MLNERAVELGRLIGQSAEYQAVKRANDSLNEDKAAMALLEKMEKLRRDAQHMIEKGGQPTSEMEQELDRLLGEVQTNATYQRVVVTNENFDKVMVQVNQWILEGIRKGATSSIITLG